jgi:hypothetical protein
MATVASMTLKALLLPLPPLAGTFPLKESQICLTPLLTALRRPFLPSSPVGGEEEEEEERDRRSAGCVGLALVSKVEGGAKKGRRGVLVLVPSFVSKREVVVGETEGKDARSLLLLLLRVSLLLHLLLVVVGGAGEEGMKAKGCLILAAAAIMVVGAIVATVVSLLLCVCDGGGLLARTGARRRREKRSTPMLRRGGGAANCLLLIRPWGGIL